MSCKWGFSPKVEKQNLGKGCPWRLWKALIYCCCCCCCCWVDSVVSDSSRPHGLQPTRLLSPWDFPGKSTGVGCLCFLRLIYYWQSKMLCKWAWTCTCSGKNLIKPWLSLRPYKWCQGNVVNCLLECWRHNTHTCISLLSNMHTTYYFKTFKEIPD